MIYIKKSLFVEEIRSRRVLYCTALVRVGAQSPAPRSRKWWRAAAMDKLIVASAALVFRTEIQLAS
jgi:hypothetical protein